MEKIDKLVVNKYGSAVITDENGLRLDTIKENGQVMADSDIAQMLVSSGAVAAGSENGTFNYIEDPLLRKRIKSGSGNPKLFNAWQNSLGDKKLIMGLVTHKDFKEASRSQKLMAFFKGENLSIPRDELLRLIQALYQNKTAAVMGFNDNDILNDAELKAARNGEFGDNDENASRIAQLSTEIAEQVILTYNTSANGVYEWFKSKDEHGEVIEQLTPDEITPNFLAKIAGDKTDVGTGGIDSKLIQAKYALDGGVEEVHIINGADSQNLKAILEGGNSGTKIIKSHNLGEI